jgi:hypothetical protein
MGNYLGAGRPGDLPEGAGRDDRFGRFWLTSLRLDRIDDQSCRERS